ncbi:hypothetical protein PBRA_001702 [Plasmodiophora brassicae]|uniref:Uncharacterized protein n=1 Tax=Plasmodiophora brassicae TaxID=37360 RepID=A0A0G4IZ93_PLABS|nr:hypothetical protein PBRA_001702 [Plasmodiophora brassicae]
MDRVTFQAVGVVAIVAIAGAVEALQVTQASLGSSMGSFMEAATTNLMLRITKHLGANHCVNNLVDYSSASFSEMFSNCLTLCQTESDCVRHCLTSQEVSPGCATCFCNLLECNQRICRDACTSGSSESSVSALVSYMLDPVLTRQIRITMTSTKFNGTANEAQ